MLTLTQYHNGRQKVKSIQKRTFALNRCSLYGQCRKPIAVSKLHTWQSSLVSSWKLPTSSAATQECNGRSDVLGAPNAQSAALHASFEAARALAAADASYTGQFAVAALRVLQHGTTGMRNCQ